MHLVQKIFGFLKDRSNISMLLFIFVALAISWATIDQIEYNYQLEQNQRRSEEEVALLEQKKANQELQNQFYQTDYYKELAVRDELGLVAEGEKIAVIDKQRIRQIQERHQAKYATEKLTPAEELGEPSPLEQWVRFFTGKNPL